MHTGRYVFAQIMDYLPMYEFHKCVDRYRGDYRVRFSCMDQYLTMAFAYERGGQPLTEDSD